MRPPLSFAGVAAVAAMLSGTAAAAAAQADTTRRDPTPSRVPVAKERPVPSAPSSGVPVAKTIPAPRDTTTTRVSTGEVAPARDTIPARTGAPAAVAPRRPPPAVQEPEPPAMRYVFGTSGFFVGAGAGAVVPYGALNDIGFDPGVGVSGTRSGACSASAGRSPSRR
jgi:hypothetical protein